MAEPTAFMDTGFIPARDVRTSVLSKSKMDTGISVVIPRNRRYPAASFDASEAGWHGTAIKEVRAKTTPLIRHQSKR